MLTIGYIGNGKSTNRYHLPFILQRSNFKVKTIFNPDVKHPKWKKMDDILYTSNLAELMEDPDIAMIVVCTTQKFHFEYAKMALEHGKHVLVEKPFMMTLKEAEDIFALAEEKGLMAQCYQNRRYDSDFLTVKKVIDSGVLGDLLEVEMHFDYYRPEVPESSKEFVFYDSYLYGHGCHTLDQVVSYFGQPDSVVYDVRRLLGENRMNDYFDLDLFYGNKKVSVKSSYFRIKERPSFVVYGTRGMFVKETKDRQEEHLKLFYMPGQPGFGEDEFKHWGILTYQDESGRLREEKVVSEHGDYGRVYDAIYETLIHGDASVVKNEEILCVMRLLEQGIQTIH